METWEELPGIPIVIGGELDDDVLVESKIDAVNVIEAPEKSFGSLNLNDFLLPAGSGVPFK